MKALSLKATVEMAAHLIPALINGDTSGLDANDEYLLEAFEAEHPGATYNVLEGTETSFCSLSGMLNECTRVEIWMAPHFEATQWQERDRLHLSLTDAIDGQEILDLWDEDARQLIEDGFIDPRNLLDTMTSYARSINLI